MSSTYAEAEAAAVPRPATRPWIRRIWLARWQAVLLGLAAISVMAYGLGVIAMLQERWLASNTGDAMRLDAVVNLAAAAIIATGLLTRMPVLVLVGGAAVLWAALQPGSAAAWPPSMLLPWAVSLVAGAMLVAASRLGRAWVALTVIGLIAFGVALGMSRELAALAFAIAAFATLLIWALLDLAWRAARSTPLP